MTPCAHTAETSLKNRCEEHGSPDETSGSEWVDLKLGAGGWCLVFGSMDLREILVDFAAVHNPAQFDNVTFQNETNSIIAHSCTISRFVAF